MNRWPSRYWKVNVAWIAVVAMAVSLLAAFRHLGLPPGDLRKASVKTLRFRFFEIPGRITHGQRKTWLHLAGAENLIRPGHDHLDHPGVSRPAQQRILPSGRYGDRPRALRGNARSCCFD